MDTFGLEKAGCRLSDTVERLTSLNSDHVKKEERLTAYTTPLESSHRANLRYDGLLGGSVQFWGYQFHLQRQPEEQFQKKKQEEKIFFRFF